MEDLWWIEFLGALTLRRGETVITRLKNRKAVELMAYLSISPGMKRSRSELGDRLWPDASPEIARDRLSHVLVWLRPQLEPQGVVPNSVLAADRSRVGLVPQTVRVDVLDFEAAHEASRRTSEPNAKIERLTHAQQLYRGEFLAGFDEAWVAEERERLAEALHKSLRCLAELHLTRAGEGDLATAEAYARRAVAADPTVEEAHLTLLRILSAAGKSAEAVRQFRELEKALDSAFGEKPSANAYSLVEAIRVQALIPAVSPDTSRFSRSPRLTGDRIGGQIPTPIWAPPPVPLTRFFGREAEIDDFEALICSEGARLVTLLGPGGSGKTRLALEALRRIAPRFGGAAAFVALADLADPRLIPTTIADALSESADRGGDPMNRIVRAIDPMPKALILLDNLEHLIDGAVYPIRDLLDVLPKLQVVVTSRQRVGIEGERELSVGPLPLPSKTIIGAGELPSLPSVGLFVDRARAVRPAFAVTEANAEAVAALSVRLEGIPLAIELCAAWAQTLTPADMLRELDNRFALLVSRRADAPERHRTLRAAIEYSFDRLPLELRTLFTKWSVFRGGWTREAAAAVGGSQYSLDSLTALRDRSLILTEESPDGTMRYRMLESLREFAVERLSDGEERALHRAHAAYYLDLAEAIEPNLDGPDAAECLRLLEAEHDNLRAALRFYRDVLEPRQALRLASALGRFWVTRGYLQEGSEWLDRLLSLPDAESVSCDAKADASVRAMAFNMHAVLLHNFGDIVRGKNASEEAVTLARRAGDQRLVSLTLRNLGNNLQRLRDMEAARAAYEESVAIARELGDEALAAPSLSNLGYLCYNNRQLSRARSYFEESLEIFVRTGRTLFRAITLNGLGVTARHQGDYEAAAGYLREAVALHRDLGIGGGTAAALNNLGMVSRLQGNYAEAAERIRDGLAIASEIGDKFDTACCLKELGHVRCAEGAFVEGARLLGAAETLCAALRSSFKPNGADEIVAERAAMRTAIGDAPADDAFEAGRVVPLERIVAEALAIPSSVITKK